MNAVNRRIGVFLLCGSLMLVRCATDQVSGGTSTSENGRVAGKIVSGDGSAAARTLVSLLAASYDPVKDTAAPAISDTTDSAGCYSLTDVTPGSYAVTCVNIDNRTRAITYDVEVDRHAVELADLTLRRPGAIKIALPDSADAASGYVYIPGTGISAPVPARSAFAVLDSVPPGTVPRIVYASTASVRTSVLESDVGVGQGDTAAIFFTGWKYCRHVRLNTSASGAGISQTLYRFPVLIRLTRLFFPFDQALPDGSDLLFTKQDSTVLPCEIERWDAVSRTAEIWVAVDTLPGNDSSFELTMHWGNTRAADNAVGTVFDTAAGFAGVWHLADAGDTVVDATVNRYNGIRYGSAASAPGAIGRGLRFDTSAAYCEMGNSFNPGNGGFTVSAWIKRDTTGIQAVLSKSNGGSPHSSYGWLFTFGEDDQLECFIAAGGTTWGTAGSFGVFSRADAIVADTSQWHFIVAAIDRSGNDASKVYIDGVDVTGNAPGGDVAAVESIVNTLPLRIGAEADGDYQWSGFIDECVVANTVRSAAWVRLSYINQGPNDLLVEFR